ncbi:MAG: hypothetical protein HS108_14340 [Planctomycetes bacterium]|nr:hypothetical protein [Planctomycetota bacterium]
MTTYAKSIAIPPTVQEPFIDAPCKIITDFTYSMDPIIAMVRRNISVAVAECAAGKVNLMPAFLVVRDLIDNKRDEGLRDDGFMTVDEFKNKLEKEPVIANTTDPESQLDAILAAIRGPWPNMKPRHPKNIVLTTNSGPHRKTLDGLDAKEVLKLAIKNGCFIHIIGPEDADYLKLCRETGGMFFDINKHNDAESYKRIFAKLGKTITQTARNC